MNPSNFDEVVEWMMQECTKQDLELASEIYIPGVLENIHGIKKSAEVVAALAKSHGYEMKGPKRMKMTSIIVGCLLAKSARNAD